MATFISLQRTEPEYCNLTYFLHAADKPCPMLRGSTVIVVNDEYTQASYIRSIFGRSARIAQLVRFQTANLKVSGSILLPGRGLNFERPSFATPPVDRDVKPLV